MKSKKTPVNPRRGEGYIDIAVKLLIAVVCGALLLGSLFWILKDTVLTNVDAKISGMFGTPASSPGGSVDDPDDTGGEKSLWSMSGGTLTQYNGEITEGMTLVIPSEVDGIPVEKVQHKDADADSVSRQINILGTTQDTSVAAVIVETGIQEIGECSFAGMESLTTVNVPASVQAIGDMAFSKTSVSVLTIPSSTTIVSSKAVDKSTIVNQPYDGSSQDWTVWSGNIAKYKGAVPEDGVLRIPNSVNSVPVKIVSGQGTTPLVDSAMAAQLTSIVISPGIEQLNSYVISGMNLSQLVLPDTLKTVSSNSIVNTVFSCPLILPDSVTVINGSAFNGSTSSAIKLSKKLTSISASAFTGFTCLGEIVVPEGVTTMGNMAFKGTTAPKVVLPSTLTIIPSECFANSNIPTVVIPEGVTSIIANAFNESGLTSLTLPNTLTQVGDKAFSGCTGLSGEMYFPNSVKSIGNYIFRYCTNVTLISVGPNTTYGGLAFQSFTVVKRSA